MSQVFKKFPFLIELFCDGSFILLFSLRSADKIPFQFQSGELKDYIETGAFFIPIVIALVVFTNFLEAGSLEEFVRKYVFSLVIFVPLVITWGDVEFAFWLSSAHLLSSVLTIYDDDTDEGIRKQRQGYAIFQGIKLRPAQLVLFSFFVIGIITNNFTQKIVCYVLFWSRINVFFIVCHNKYTNSNLFRHKKRPFEGSLRFF